MYVCMSKDIHKNNIFGDMAMIALLFLRFPQFYGISLTTTCGPQIAIQLRPGNPTNVCFYLHFISV